MGAAVAQLAFPVPPKGRFAEALRKRSVPFRPPGGLGSGAVFVGWLVFVSNKKDQVSVFFD